MTIEEMIKADMLGIDYEKRIVVISFKGFMEATNVMRLLATYELIAGRVMPWPARALVWLTQFKLFRLLACGWSGSRVELLFDMMGSLLFCELNDHINRRNGTEGNLPIRFHVFSEDEKDENGVNKFVMEGEWDGKVWTLRDAQKPTQSPPQPSQREGEGGMKANE